jgi:uncharacterized membrane protein
LLESVPRHEADDSDGPFRAGHPSLSFALLLASLGCALMLALRWLATGSSSYAVLLWNLFLAWVPYALSLLTRRLCAVPRMSSRRKLAAAGTGLVWLFFFPNATYILTDFIHVVQEAVGLPAGRPYPPIAENAVLWYDIILISGFGFVGHMLGLISLVILHRAFSARIGRRFAWGFVAGATLLSGYGIYLGRFARFNSWDVFRHPITTLLVALVNLLNLEAVLFSLAFAFFILLTYLVAWSLYYGGERIGPAGERR